MYHKLLFVLLVACQPMFPLVLTPSEDDPTRRAVDAVVSSVNAAAGEEWLQVGPDGIAVRRICGVASDEIWISSCVINDTLPIILTHEIGHTFGLSHSTDTSSVMYKRFHAMPIEDAASSLVHEFRSQR